MEFVEFPNHIEKTQFMENPNDEVIFHEGEFTVNWQGYYMKCIGAMYFQWLPRLTIKFKWKPDSETKKLWRPLETEIGVEITSENSEINAKGVISKFLNKDDYIHCVLSNQIKYGTKETNVDFVRFEIANLRSFNGNYVRNKETAKRNRLEFINIEYKITIDQYWQYMSLKGNLSENGGYQLLYTGKLESIDKNKLTYKRTSEILESLSYFLIFLNGRRCFPLFRTGWIDDEIVWGDFTPYFNDEYKYVYSWATDQKHSDIENIWKDFNNLWQDKNDRESLKTILHWYTESNSSTAFIEGSIVLLQNSLELLFHWLISEKLKYVSSYDADNLSASAKIGFLLSQFNVKPEIPEEFESLLSYAAKNNIVNGAEAFTRIRNCIVHPNHKKRKALLEIESRAKIEALHLGIWYVESILLKYLNYSGNYKNRCKTLKNINDSEKF
jgi:hypothetical protein